MSAAPSMYFSSQVRKEKIESNRRDGRREIHKLVESNKLVGVQNYFVWELKMFAILKREFVEHCRNKEVSFIVLCHYIKEVLY